MSFVQQMPHTRSLGRSPTRQSAYIPPQPSTAEDACEVVPQFFPHYEINRYSTVQYRPATSSSTYHSNRPSSHRRVGRIRLSDPCGDSLSLQMQRQPSTGSLASDTEVRRFSHSSSISSTSTLSATQYQHQHQHQYQHQHQHQHQHQQKPSSSGSASQAAYQHPPAPTQQQHAYASCGQLYTRQRKASSIYGLNEGIASQGRLHRYNTTKTVSHNSLLHSPTIRSPLTRSPAAYDYSSDEQTVGSAIPPCDEVHGASGVRDSKSISSTEAVTSTHVNAASSDGYYDDDADIVDKLVPKIDSLAPQFAYLPPRSSKFTITN